MKPTPTLFLLAGEGGFRLLHSASTGIAELVQKDASDFPDVAHDFTAERGRSHAMGVQFGNDGGPTDTEIERPRLATHAADALAAEWATGNYDRIVVSAGPKMLGALRKALPKPLAEMIVSELHKDLMKVAAHDLPAHFKDVLPG